MTGKEHVNLVQRSAAWLRSHSHSIVVTELTTGGGEEPDAIGFNMWLSTLIECKTSRSDFLADAKKPWRRDPARGLGYFRYFCCPKGLIDIKELPENWGLLETSGNGLRVKQPAKPIVKRNYRAEISILVSVLRRVGQSPINGISVRCYTYNTGNRATVGIESPALVLSNQTESSSHRPI